MNTFLLENCLIKYFFRCGAHSPNGYSWSPVNVEQSQTPYNTHQSEAPITEFVLRNGDPVPSTRQLHDLAGSPQPSVTASQYDNHQNSSHNATSASSTTQPQSSGSTAAHANDTHSNNAAEIVSILENANNQNNRLENLTSKANNASSLHVSAILAAAANAAASVHGSSRRLNQDHDSRSAFTEVDVTFLPFKKVVSFLNMQFISRTN